jgi:archaellum biogenesis protein FlaJ (TadC family)
MFSTITGNTELMWQLAAVSVTTFFTTLLLVPVILIRLPSDYFAHRHRKSRAEVHRSFVTILVAISKNILGFIFVAAGIAMLILPGQGILTILVGLMLINFPGKYHAEQWLVSRSSVLRSINWIRSRAHKPPFRINPDNMTNR